ncbi:MAG: protein kinase [Planctomycetales bacterium]|nr:protein kinase [Planctomycetales bacterium]
MNSDKPEPHGSSSEDSREKWIAIDRLCDAYEASLQEGEVERAPFLAGVPHDWRDQLKHELDAIDAAYRDAEETREQTVKVPPTEANSRRLPTSGRLAELATLDRDKIWLGRFEIRKRLGTGATGSVWCARDARLARWVALKVPHASRVMSENSAARFQTEARAAAAINHPNVVQVHEVLIEDGLPILIQQWIDGPSLARYLKDKGPLDFDQAADWMSQIADAVACAHEKGIVHRDLKPANVMLNKNRPMVLDFGLASYPQFSTGLTSEGTILGTPAYMSPEQAEGNEHANQPGTDIYALGTILYEMLVGTPPFVGKAREVLQANKTAIPTPPRSRRAAIPRDLETITLRCLSKSPHGRYRSAAELRDDLQRFRRREPIMARKVSLLENTWSWLRLRPAYALLAAGTPLVVVLFLGILIAHFRNNRLTDQASFLVKQNRQSESKRQELLTQRHMVELSRASHELSEGERTRGLELLRSIPESMRQWEWHLLDLVSHSPSTTLNVPTDDIKINAPINALAVAPKHLKMYSAANDGTVLYWKLPPTKDFFNTDKTKQVGPGPPIVLFRASSPVHAITVSPDENWLAWVDRSGVVTIWDVIENEYAQRIVLPKVKRGHGISFSPDSKRLVIGGGSLPSGERSSDQNSWLFVFQVSDSGEFTQLGERRFDNRTAITSLCFISNSQFAVTRGRLDGTVGAMGFVEVFECAVDDIHEVGQIWRGLSMHGLDFNATSNRIAWCDIGGMAYVKDLSQPLFAPPRQFQASRRPATQVRFSPDGQELIVTGNDGDVSRWYVPSLPRVDEEAPADTQSPSTSIAVEVDMPDDGDNDEDGSKDGQKQAVNPTNSQQSVASSASIQEPTVEPPPIRHVRDYRGHENIVRDAIYLAPCQQLGGKAKAKDPRYRFCKPFLVTCGDDGRVLQWSNDGHDAIKTLNLGDQPLVDAQWLSPVQVAVATTVPRRQKMFFKTYAFNDIDLSVETRRITGARMMSTIARHDSLMPTGKDEPAPVRYAIGSRTRIDVFDTGNSEFIASRLLTNAKRSGFTTAAMINSRYLVALNYQQTKPTKEQSKANPNTPGTIRKDSLLLYDLHSDSPPQKLALPSIGTVTRLKVSPHGDQVFGCSNAGKMFSVSLQTTAKGEMQWSTQPVRFWTAHNRAVRDFQWIGRQERLATVSDDGTCAIWNLAPEETLTAAVPALPPTRDITTADDVVEAESAIDRSESDFPQLTQRLLVSSEAVTRVTVSSTGDRIVTVGADRVIRIWDTHSGLELVSLEPRKESVVAVEFSPDDRFILIAEANSRLEIIRLVD